MTVASYNNEQFSDGSMYTTVILMVLYYSGLWQC